MLGGGSLFTTFFGARASASEGRPDIVKRSFQATRHGGERANPHLEEAADASKGFRERGPPDGASRVGGHLLWCVVVEEPLDVHTGDCDKAAKQRTNCALRHS